MVYGSWVAGFQGGGRWLGWRRGSTLMVDGSSVSSLQVVSTVNGGESLRFEFLARWVFGFSIWVCEFFLAFFWVVMEWFGQICGLMLICCGLLVVCAQICGLTVGFLGGGCLFSLPDLVFGEIGGGFMVYVHLGVVVDGFCLFGVVGGGLHF